MSPEAQRIAIAEVCGWTDCRAVASRMDDKPWLSGYNPAPYRPVSAFTYDGEPIVLPIACRESLPDYLNDLNATHEAEKVLKPYQAEEYVMALACILLNEVSRDLLTYEQTANWYNIFVLLNATASQRAEAFLRTLGKWVPND